MVTKRPRLFFRLFLPLLYACASPVSPASAGPLVADVVQVYFSPNGGATEAVVNELGNAKTEVLLQAYFFTSAPIAEALMDAHKRGVKVTVVLDRSQRSERDIPATFVAKAGIPTYIDAKHPVANNNIMVIDQAVVITGSFNFTKAAEEKNAENLLVIKGNPELVKRYLANFKEHLEHSEKCEGR